MFFVINKEKIVSFVLAVGMVGVLFGLTNTPSEEEMTKETSSIIQNQVESNQINKIDQSNIQSNKINTTK